MGLAKYNKSMKKLFYRVQKNDSLLGVSRRFGLPVCKIVWLNRLEREVESGDMLYLEVDETKRVYSVEAGETLESLAKKFDVSGESILKENGIDGVYFGEEIIIP